MREAEDRVIAAGTSERLLMERAGQGAARIAVGMAPPGAKVAVLCGPGKNGGDAAIAAEALAAAGFAVTVARLDAAADTPASAIAPGAFDLVVDGLFGTGLSRDLQGAAAATVESLNASGTPVLALDMPSGIDADTGAVRGVAVRATRTITFGCRKPGHLLFPGRAHAGRLDVVDIGVPAHSDLVVNGPDLWGETWPRLAETAHKYDRGHALVVSGPPHGTGAARLAARAALRAGAGLVSVVTSARALAVNAAHLTAIMMKVCDDPDAFADLLTDDRFNAVALGPGLGVGEETRRWVEAALEADRATVIDADALTSFRGEADALAALIGAGRERPAILTPHDGEFARLFEADAALRALPSRLDRALGAAERTGAVIVLKGADTTIASPDGRAAVNPNGTPHLGTAGTGDVLAGIVAGLCARGMPGYEAACAAVWIHAEAARRFGAGLISEDLPDLLPGVLRDLESA